FQVDDSSLLTAILLGMVALVEPLHQFVEAAFHPLQTIVNAARVTRVALVLKPVLEVRHVEVHAAVAVEHTLDRRTQILRQLLDRFRIVARDGPGLIAALYGHTRRLAILALHGARHAVRYVSAFAAADHDAVTEVAEFHRSVAAELTTAELAEQVLNLTL